jgi:hypothetical protein
MTEVGGRGAAPDRAAHAPHAPPTLTLTTAGGGVAPDRAAHARPLAWRLLPGALPGRHWRGKSLATAARSSARPLAWRLPPVALRLPGSPRWSSQSRLSPSRGSRAGVSGPDASDLDPLLKQAAWPDWSRLAKYRLLRIVVECRYRRW